MSEVFLNQRTSFSLSGPAVCTVSQGRAADSPAITVTTSTDSRICHLIYYVDWIIVIPREDYFKSSQSVIKTSASDLFSRWTLGPQFRCEMKLQKDGFSGFLLSVLFAWIKLCFLGLSVFPESLWVPRVALKSSSILCYHYYLIPIKYYQNKGRRKTKFDLFEQSIRR